MSARPPSPGADTEASPGIRTLGIIKARDALLYVPQGAKRPSALVVSLHGAGGHGQHGIDLLRARADEHGFVLLSPPSRKQTWDIILGAFGPDVEFINTALERTFATQDIDSTRIAIGGFSDGASYALTLGLTNGDLFRHVLAFSPGFTAHPSKVGRPSIFMWHATRDAVLPIDACSRRLAPRLQAEGYQVDYREFDGAHTVPEEVSRYATEQFSKL